MPKKHSHFGKISLIASLILISGCNYTSDIKTIEIDVKEVSFATEDKVELRGTLYTNNQKGPGILLMHQCMEGSDRESWSNVAESLAKEGYHVLTFNFRGYGDSDGAWPDFESMPEFINVCRSVVSKDVDAAYEFLKSLDSVDKNELAIGGASCGVFMGIDLAYYHPEIKSMVLLSGPFDIVAQEKLSTMGKIPVLSAASVDDVRAFEAMNRVFATTTNINSILIQMKGSQHGTFMFKMDLDLENRIVKWFERWLPVSE